MSKILIDEATLEDYKKTAVKWNTTLTDLPIRVAQDVLGHMHGITGLRGTMQLPEVSADSQFAPFKKNRTGSSDVKIKYRKITNYLGNAVDPFSPVDYAALTMGYDDPIVGEAIKGASTTALVLFYIAKARGQHIAQAVLTGVRNEEGDTTEDLCDGLLTIAGKEIEAGAISKEEGNYIKLQDEFSFQNACDLLKEEIIFKLNPFMRQENNLLLCDPELVDMYNQSYQATHTGLNYNKAYNQPFVEGSFDKVTLIGLPEMAGQKRMILTQKDNMWWATYNKADERAVDIMRKDHYTLSFAANMWLGTQFRTIDKRRLTIIDLAGESND
ncbi:MAG: hypothetical protein K2M56_00915 [Muribaculaceae bacterium]|nr:hypothetical protein [Muribaculaceae bacterium]